MALRPTKVIDTFGTTRSVYQLNSAKFIIQASKTELKVFSANGPATQCSKTLHVPGCNGFGIAGVINSDRVVLWFDNYVQIMDIRDGRMVAASKRKHSNIWWCTMINSNTGLLCDLNGVVTKITWDDSEMILTEPLMGFDKYSFVTTADFQTSSTYISCNTFVTTSPRSKIVKMWDLSKTLLKKYTLDVVCYRRVAFNDTYLVASGVDSKLYVYMIRGGELVSKIANHSEYPRCMCFLGTHTIVSGAGNVLAVHELPSGNCVASYEIDNVARQIAVLSCGKIAVSTSNETIAIYDIKDVLSSSYVIQSSLIDQVETNDSTHTNQESGEQSIRRDLVECQQQLALKDRQLVLNHAELAEKERQLAQKEKLLDANRTQIQANEMELALFQIEIRKERRLLEKNEQQLEEKQHRIDELESAITAMTIAQHAEIERQSEVCCICLERFQRGDDVFRLPCMHVHHAGCVLPYLKRSDAPRCPICRTAVPAEFIDHLPVWKWSLPGSSRV